MLFLCVAACLYCEVNKLDRIDYDVMDAISFGVGGGSSESKPERVPDLLGFT